MGHYQDFPILFFLDVVYSLFYAGTMIEKGAGGLKVFVGRHQLVAVLGGVGVDEGSLVFEGGEFSFDICPDVRCRPCHVGAMIACGASGIIPVQAVRRDVAQSGSALGWGPSGRRFKSGRPDFCGNTELSERPRSVGYTQSTTGHHGLYGHDRDLLFRRLCSAGLYLGPPRRRPVSRATPRASTILRDGPVS